MKRISTSDFQTLLDEQMAWRIQEIASIRSEAKGATGSWQRTIIRAGISLLYAHWEGFVKSSSDDYLRFVASKKISKSRLKYGLMALAFQPQISALKDNPGSKTSSEYVATFMDTLDKPAKELYLRKVDTESNLSSKVFANIVGWVCIASDTYATKSTFIDATLLRMRNKIAHGEHLEVGAERFDDIAEQTINLMRLFKTDLQNAASTDAYLRD